MDAYKPEICLICRRSIAKEIPNDWDPYLCFDCAQKEHFKRRKERLPSTQKTIFDSIK